MYTVMGVTGRVGGAVARSLLAAGQPVRAIVRDKVKARPWAARGCEIAVANLEDFSSLAAAFRGSNGVFLLVPPRMDPTPGFPEAAATAAALRAALSAAQPEQVVYLSTIGAQSRRTNLLTQHTIIEHVLGQLPMPVTFLRPTWFMENFSWDIAGARDSGVIPCYLQPLDQEFSMVATADVGRVAAELLQESAAGHRVVELEGPRRVTPNEVASTLAELLGRPVRMEAVPHELWEQRFRQQGMRNPRPRSQMLDGFNTGWIDFERKEPVRKGAVGLATVLKGLIEPEMQGAA